MGDDHNLYFMGVARVDGRGIVVASYNNEADIDLAGVKQVLEQPNMNMQADKHYSFAVGANQAWHLISDDMSLIYILICQHNYPQRCAHACLQELQRSFRSKAGDKATTAKDRQLDKACLNLFQVLCKKYNNLAEVDKLAAVAKKVETVKLVMQVSLEEFLSLPSSFTQLTLRRSYRLNHQKLSRKTLTWHSKTVSSLRTSKSRLRSCSNRLASSRETQLISRTRCGGKT